MKACQLEAAGTVASTYIGVETMINNAWNNYVLVAINRRLTIAKTVSANLFSKRNAIRKSPTYLEDSASWFQGLPLTAISAYFLDRRHRSAFLTKQSMTDRVGGFLKAPKFERTSERGAFV